MAGQEVSMCRTVRSLYFLCTLYGVWMKYECGALVEWWLAKTEKKLGEVHIYPPKIPHGLTWKQIWAYVVTRKVLQGTYQLSFHYWSMVMFIHLALITC